MNGYQRIRAALDGNYPDKVPIMLHNFMFAAREAGYTMKQFRENPKVIADTFIQAVEKYEYDGILVDVDTVTLAGAVGVPIDFPEDEPARSNKGSLKSIEMVRQLKPVDISTYVYIRNWLEGVERIHDYFKDEIFLRGNCDQCPFSLASMMRSPEAWMMDLLDTKNKALVIELLEYCTDAAKQFIRLMKRTGAHMVSNGDAPAGPELISPLMYKEYALPYEKHVVDEAHKLDLPYCLHICGDTASIIDKMIETGSDALEIDYKTNIKYTHKVCKDNVVFIGNIDPSGVIALGSVDMVKQKTLELLNIYNDSPKFIFNAGCAIPSITPSENIKTMINTARNFR